MAVDVNKTLIEVTLNDRQTFLQIKETLTRIGIASYKTKTLFQTAHILHKKGKYYIVHFKQLFEMDGRQSTITQQDHDRTYAIAALLEQWNLLSIVNKRDLNIKEVLPSIKIIPFKEKREWNLVPKYQIGIKHF